MDAVDLAVETTKQLITLSSAIITILFAFVKDLFDRFRGMKWTIDVGIGAHFLSVVCGLWTLMAITGSVAGSSGGAADIYARAITLPSVLQIGFFLLGLMLMMVALIQTSMK